MPSRQLKANSSSDVPTEVTGLLQAWRSGDVAAEEKLFDRLYGELKKIAVGQLRGERPELSLQPTSVVHEAYLKLLPQRGVDWRDRAHFYGLAATMMRRVLVDHARAKGAKKRQADDAAPPESFTIAAAPEVELLDLDAALGRFAESYPRQARVVEMRYFAELEVEEIAEVVGASPATVKRDWRFARAWLHDALTPPRSGS